MKAKILDKKLEVRHEIDRDIIKTCYLVKLSLKDYILALPPDYKSYYVQREIVHNPYLDNLINTVLNEGHIPSIVLIIDYAVNTETSPDLDIQEFKILDGLQRTHRLKVIWDTIQLLNDAIKTSTDILDFGRLKISREYSKQINQIESSSNILSKLIEYQKSHLDENIEDKFAKNFMWFEVWSGLDPNEEVQKMLILNAGHKPVKTKHQLELLFNNLVPIITKTSTSDFQLIKEKEQSSIQHSKNRAVGHFHFSHIISAVLSYEAGKPVTTNINLIQKTQNEDFNDEFDIKYDYDFFKTFITTIVKFDKSLQAVYKELGTQWLGREITLVGLFAASGKLAKEKNNLSFYEVCDIIDRQIIQNPPVLDLAGFEKARNSLDLSKVNIGNINKTAVYDGLYDILTGKVTQKINWQIYFKTGIDENN
ncbi:hypothetical protein LLH06_08030 [Mucilaginibacter daejeonensis]|uniref:hypothetical protein n=1 Tax=Mucilaginibacter daejeonensis TaxID=398049 RepID=UPI001D17167B|nr:hypothetical protein [Mucilaginibacter daejeonensis]UEG54912.1 hypothetical protein LLH06_08030 [Mucilaginibacter daejeonensis]